MQVMLLNNKEGREEDRKVTKLGKPMLGDGGLFDAVYRR